MRVHESGPPPRIPPPGTPPPRARHAPAVHPLPLGRFHRSGSCWTDKSGRPQRRRRLRGAGDSLITASTNCDGGIRVSGGGGDDGVQGDHHDDGGPWLHDAEEHDLSGSIILFGQHLVRNRARSPPPRCPRPCSKGRRPSRSTSWTSSSLALTCGQAFKNTVNNESSELVQLFSARIQHAAACWDTQDAPA